MQVRRWLSTAEVARCSFKDKAIAEVDVLFFLNLHVYNVLTPIQVITVAYQGVMDTITKCLRLFAEDQQYDDSPNPFSYR